MKLIRTGNAGQEKLGVGPGQKPPLYLQPGDVVELGISGPGSRRLQAVAA